MVPHILQFTTFIFLSIQLTTRTKYDNIVFFLHNKISESELLCSESLD